MWLIRSPNLCGRCFCVAEKCYFKTISANAGGDWKLYPTHARFTYNPGENIAEFRPGGSNSWRCSKHHLSQLTLSIRRQRRYLFPSSAAYKIRPSKQNTDGRKIQREETHGRRALVPKVERSHPRSNTLKPSTNIPFILYTHSSHHSNPPTS
jgi:hypothetical protein